MKLLDTHLHLLYPARFSYAWTAELPALTGEFSLDTYRAQCGASVVGAFWMEADVPPEHSLEEALFFDQMAQNEPFLLGAIASARPENDEFKSQLDALSGLERVRGVRRILHTSPDALSQNDSFRARLRLLAEYELPFDLCVLERQLPLALDLVRSCPDVRFLLDHLGVPDIVGHQHNRKAFESWRLNLAALALEPNVSAKISGLPAYAPPDWTSATLRPYVETALEAFGAERLMWGSDFPVCNLGGGLGRWLETTHEILGELSGDEQNAIGWQNAARFYGVSYGENS